jgi:hypothetical protein
MFPYGMPGYGTTALPFQGVPPTGPVPIHQLRMPSSPSPIPSYVMASTVAPVFTTAGAQPFTATTVAPVATTATTSAIVH